MLGRKDYTREELDHARRTVDRQLGAYRKLVKAVNGARANPKVAEALEEFEPLFINNMILALDRPFVHRLRMSTGKDGNPLNEVELLTDSLINNDGKLRGNNVIKLDPDQSVIKLSFGERIRLSATQFGRLSKAFFAELDGRFVK